MRTSSRRPIATSLLLVGSMFLLAGCGDQGAHLPAGMTGSSAAYAGTTAVGVSTMVDDPVLAGYDGIDAVGGLGTDDVYGRAIADWNETEGALGGLDTDIEDDFGDDGFLPVGYGGGGYGYGDDFGYGGGYGYGNGIMTAAMSGGGWGGAGLMDAGFVDPGFEDPGFVDAGFDPGFADVGMDPGFANVGFDPGFVDAGVGVADIGVADVGIVDAGIEGMVF